MRLVPAVERVGHREGVRLGAVEDRHRAPGDRRRVAPLAAVGRDRQLVSVASEHLDRAARPPGSRSGPSTSMRAPRAEGRTSGAQSAKPASGSCRSSSPSAASAASAWTSRDGSAGSVSAARWRSISPVSSRPAAKSGCRPARARKPRLVVEPATRVASSAARERPERRGARRPVRDQLGDHRVVPGADRSPARTPESARSRGEGEVRQRAGRRQEARGRVLGVEPRLDGVAVDGELLLA